ncbi:NADP-dependent malic enzyme-like [Nymphaea colorata]|nr:NADP-dependent malic enzyme-like [Nymphaea colorata]
MGPGYSHTKPSTCPVVGITPLSSAPRSFLPAIIQPGTRQKFEDFANHNAFELLAKYGTTHLVFNDDIQGTASVVLAGLIAALKLVGGSLAEHTFLFLGAGEAGTGIEELIALEMSRQTKAPLEECRKRIWLVDSKITWD